MAAITNDQLSKIAEAIVRSINPSLLILLGSQSRGTANNDSDIDLLVVSERPKEAVWSRRRMVGTLRRSLPSADVPVDILLFTPEEFARWKGTTNHVVRRALREGSVLYERP